jgi:N6-L-threonylcarbamoyladenine synthase
MKNQPVILAIESSCDDTSAAVMRGTAVLSNEVASQQVHVAYGGVVPELASRAHQANIVPVVDHALKVANIAPDELDAIAFTAGPGLMGSLLVGASFAKSLALSLNIPLISVHHMHAHILAHLIDGAHNPAIEFPFICLTVSGGHTQLVKVESASQMTVMGETIDDAVGEAFDKAAKILGLSYPGGPEIDRLAKLGNPKFLSFSKPKVDGYGYSFSGMKTSFLYTMRKHVEEDKDFVSRHMNDICASFQQALIDALMDKLKLLVADTGIKNVAIAGGVSANSALRSTLASWGRIENISIFVPPFAYTTDNAAMIGIAGYYKYIESDFVDLGISAAAKIKF